MESIAFPRLGGGMVHFKDTHNVGQVRAAVSEGVQPGAEDHVLGNSAFDSLLKFIFEITTTRYDRSSKIATQGLGKIGTNSRGKFRVQAIKLRAKGSLAFATGKLQG